MKTEKTFEDLLKEMNERLGSNVTTKVVFDKMYQKKVCQFEDEKGNAFFRCYPEMSTIDIWNEDVMQIAERRYKEIYQGEKELFGYFQNAV